MQESSSSSSPNPTSVPDSEAAAEPFEPGPANLSGCGKPAVVGCLIVLVVLAVALVALVSQAPRLAQLLVGQMQEQITAALPEDLSAAERERLEAAFVGAGSALREGRVDPTSARKLQRVAAALPARGEKLTRDEVLQITDWLEEIAAVAPPGGEADPARPVETQPVGVTF